MHPCTPSAERRPRRKRTLAFTCAHPVTQLQRLFALYSHTVTIRVLTQLRITAQVLVVRTAVISSKMYRCVNLHPVLSATFFCFAGRAACGMPHLRSLRCDQRAATWDRRDRVSVRTHCAAAECETLTNVASECGKCLRN